MACFGFVDTWLAKRKEKRREKKRRAVSARANGLRNSAKIPVKVTKGGVAFNMGFDERVPTPFRGLRPRPGSKMHMSDMDKQKTFEASTARRQEMLATKTEFARECNRKVETFKAIRSTVQKYKQWRDECGQEEDSYGEMECHDGAVSPSL